MCFYWKKDGSNLVVVGVYVHDLLATDTNVEAVDRFFGSLGILSIKDLGAVSKFLGMRVAVDDDRSDVVDQEGAIDHLLREHGLEMRILRELLLGLTVTKFHRQTARC